jgi:LysR family transcriptional activator of mexEF-oprN operon
MMRRLDESGLRQFDLNLLTLFSALMRERSVTRAGEAVFLSQPATSKALARLRAFFRDELFIRQGAVLEPTPRAEALMAQIGPLLQGMVGAIAGAVPFSPEVDARVFRIGMSEAVGMSIIPLLPHFREAAPHCRISIRAATYRTIPGMLESGEINTALGYVEDLPATTKRRVLRRDGWVVLRDARTPGPVDLDAYCTRSHMLVTPRGDLTGTADEALEKLGRSRRVVLGVPDFGLMPQTLLGTELLCLVTGAVWEGMQALGWGERIAADPAPFPCEEAVSSIAWRLAVDQDPGEAWLRAELVKGLAGRRRNSSSQN